MYVVYFTAFISTGQIMGWGHKAIEIRSAETGHLDGVFMHKKAQKLKFLCERNDKVGQVTEIFRHLLKMTEMAFLEPMCVILY